MMPSWVLLAIAAGLLSNTFNFFSRYFLKDNDDASIWAWFFELGRFIAFSAILLFDFSIKKDPLTIVFLLSVGITELVSVYFTMKMHAYSHLSISTILSRTRIIWIPIIGFLLFKEQLHTLEYLGIFILFIGVSITISPRKFFVDKGALFANAAAFSLAFNTIFLKLALPYASYSAILVASATPSVLVFPFMIKNAKSKFLKFARERLWLKIFAVLTHIFSIYIFLHALQTGEASRVNAIYQGMLITSVFAGIFILKEKQDIVKKIVGATITIIGIILVTQ